MSRMPKTATPRMRSRLVMRERSRTGPDSAAGWGLADIGRDSCGLGLGEGRTMGVF